MKFLHLLLLALAGVAAAKTKRKALARVRNNSGQRLVGAVLAHKYSGTYLHNKVWNAVEPGQTSEVLEVEYNTGPFTTGVDWWFVSWLTVDSRTLVYSNPRNLRGSFAFPEPERDFSDPLEYAGAIAETAASSGGSTAGFKMHVLRAKDEGQVVEITINPDLTVTIKSPSGESSTVTSSKTTGIGPRRPFYAIAHRVLDVAGVKAALKHGANAIEIDVRGKADADSGFVADHDGLAFFGSRGDEVPLLLAEIAKSKQILFVWLDLKDPDACRGRDANPKCQVEALREYARNILAPAGIRVLYEFANNHGEAYDVLRKSLNGNEALGVDGEAVDLAGRFHDEGPEKAAQRIFASGIFNWDLSLLSGSKERLRKASASGLFGNSFAYTLNAGKSGHIDAFVKQAQATGLVYGRAALKYDDTYHSSGGLDDLKKWLLENKKLYRLASEGDAPW